MKLFTIGFTQKSASEFFNYLREAGVRQVIDVRLNNNSQLAGFSKKEDLAFFLKELCGISYTHLPELAPTPELFHAYKKRHGDWATFEYHFLRLMEQREIEKIDPELLGDGCLLCSEPSPHRCHRRLVAEYLEEKWGGIKVRHLG